MSPGLSVTRMGVNKYLVLGEEVLVSGSHVANGTRSSVCSGINFKLPSSCLMYVADFNSFSCTWHNHYGLASM